MIGSKRVSLVAGFFLGIAFFTLFSAIFSGRSSSNVPVAPLQHAKWKGVDSDFTAPQRSAASHRRSSAAAPVDLGPINVAVGASDTRLAASEYAHVKNPATFLQVAKNDPSGSPSDKVGYHTYHVMYGAFLVPLAKQAKQLGQKLKLLDIGLGCNMAYGAGKSVSIWQRLLGPGGEIWEAESDADCVSKAKERGMLKGIHTLVGDQSNLATLQTWSTQGGEWDVIIDDGSHTNAGIMQSFFHLFDKSLKNGGLYFIEDMSSGHGSTLWNNEVTASDVLQIWQDQLLIPNVSFGKSEKFARLAQMRKKYPLPPRIKWMMCQFEACVIAKCEHDNPNQCKPPNARNPPE